MNRNEPRPCGSGRKYKRYRAAREALAWKQASWESMVAMATAEGVSVAKLQADFDDHRHGGVM